MPKTTSVFPTAVVRQVHHAESAAWRNRAEWRVKAQIAISVLERALSDPAAFFCSDELKPMPCGADPNGTEAKLLRSENRQKAIYANELRSVFLEACQDEIDRLRLALDDNRLLASIYGRNIPKSKGGTK